MCLLVLNRNLSFYVNQRHEIVSRGGKGLPAMHDDGVGSTVGSDSAMDIKRKWSWGEVSIKGERMGIWSGDRVGGMAWAGHES